MSPYRNTAIPRVLREWTAKVRPKVIVEFGTGGGFCTSVLAESGARVVSYDTFCEPFQMVMTKWRLRKLDNVWVFRGDVLDWEPRPFDLMWLDAGPTGTMLKAVREKVRGLGVVLFEGGIPQRDLYGKAYRLNDPMVGSVPYEVVSHEFPGVSRLL